MPVNNDPVSIENLKGAISLAQECLRALHIANGGAVIALLTFYGNIAAQGRAAMISLEPLTTALNFFASGLVCGLLASALGYVSQLEAATKDRSPWEIRFRWLALASATGSLVLFSAGTIEAGRSFNPVKPAGVAAQIPVTAHQQANAPSEHMSKAN